MESGSSQRTWPAAGRSMIAMNFACYSRALPSVDRRIWRLIANNGQVGCRHGSCIRRIRRPLRRRLPTIASTDLVWGACDRTGTMPLLYVPTIYVLMSGCRPFHCAPCLFGRRNQKVGRRDVEHGAAPPGKRTDRAVLQPGEEGQRAEQHNRGLSQIRMVRS